MHLQLQHHEDLILEIKRESSRIRAELDPVAAMEAGNEIQRHLNITLTDVAESLYAAQTNIKNESAK